MVAAKSTNGTFVLLWGLANAISFGFVGAGFHNFELAPPSMGRLGNFELAPAVFGAFMGALPSLLIGWLQWLILRRYMPVSRWWIATVSAGIGLNHFLADGYPYARDPLIATLAGSALVGVLQWLVLRREFHSSVPWIWVTVSSWYLGVLVGVSLLNASGLLRGPWTGALGFQQHGLVGCALAATYGLVTGVVMMVFLHRKRLGGTDAARAPVVPSGAG